MARLTKRELEVARLTAQGYSILNISAQLNLSESTVGTHRANLYKKLGAHSAAEVTVALSREGLLETEELPDEISPANRA